MHTRYSNSIDSGSYLGLAESSIFCNSPLALNKFFSNEVSDADYSCPVSDLPFEYPNWKDKWYSPICRPWYQLQKDNPRQTTLGDLYQFANSDIQGITPCAPINRMAADVEEDEDTFVGAICLDMAPSGDINEFYPFVSVEQATYLLFNPDEAFESIQRVHESSLAGLIEQVIGGKVQQALNYDTFKINSLDAWSKRARIYDNKHITWGRLDITLSSSTDPNLVSHD